MRELQAGTLRTGGPGTWGGQSREAEGKREPDGLAELPDQPSPAAPGLALDSVWFELAFSVTGQWRESHGVQGTPLVAPLRDPETAPVPFRLSRFFPRASARGFVGSPEHRPG